MISFVFCHDPRSTDFRSTDPLIHELPDAPIHSLFFLFFFFLLFFSPVSLHRSPGEGGSFCTHFALPPIFQYGYQFERFCLHDLVAPALFFHPKPTVANHRALVPAAAPVIHWPIAPAGQKLVCAALSILLCSATSSPPTTSPTSPPSIIIEL